MEVVVTTGAIRHAKLQSNHQHPNLPTTESSLIEQSQIFTTKPEAFTVNPDLQSAIVNVKATTSCIVVFATAAAADDDDDDDKDEDDDDDDVMMLVLIAVQQRKMRGAVLIHEFSRPRGTTSKSW